MSSKRIALTTGGGDAPGLNAVIRAATLAALERGWTCVGIKDGYNGLLMPDQYGDDGLIPLNRDAVRGITHLGGTILGTTNKGNPLRFPQVDAAGNVTTVDRTEELVRKLEAAGIDALIAIGGDGSMAIAHAIAGAGFPVVGVPKTIDNDLDQTVVTFGFRTAVDFATECIDRLHPTAKSHKRIMVIEVMGRYAGWIALEAGVAGSADAILIPEIPYDINKVAAKVQERVRHNRHFSIIVVAEGAIPVGGDVTVVERSASGAERLGGVGHKVGAALEAITGQDSRVVVLGHLLRGGMPTAYDRLLSLRFGAAAIRALAEGQHDVMVALDPPTVRYVPLELATSRMKSVPLDCDTILTARDLGTSFGD
jgi:6-phosphofructokinase 1